MVVVPCVRVTTAGQMSSVLRVLSSSVGTSFWARKLAEKRQGEAALVSLVLGVLTSVLFAAALLAGKLAQKRRGEISLWWLSLA